MIVATVNGLDLLLIVFVVAGVLWLLLDHARRLDAWKDELELRHRERMRAVRRDLDSAPREQLVPFDWSKDAA